VRKQQRLKALTGTRGTKIVAAEVFDQLLAVDLAIAALDGGLRGITRAAVCSLAQKWA
jgi:hypothetical protein